MKNEEENIEKQEGNAVLPCVELNPPSRIAVLKVPDSFYTPELLTNKIMNSGSAFDDNYLANNIIEARNNHDKACEVYRNYIGSSETMEERLRRINAFRCGGW